MRPLGDLEGRTIVARTTAVTIPINRQQGARERCQVKIPDQIRPAQAYEQTSDEGLDPAAKMGWRCLTCVKTRDPADTARNAMLIVGVCTTRRYDAALHLPVFHQLKKRSIVESGTEQNSHSPPIVRLSPGSIHSCTRSAQHGIDIPRSSLSHFIKLRVVLAVLLRLSQIADLRGCCTLIKR